MLEAFMYQEEDHPDADELMAFAVRAAVSDTCNDGMAPLVGMLLDAYAHVMEFDNEEQFSEMLEKNGLLSLEDAGKLYRKVYLSICNSEESAWIVDSIPQDKSRLYPREFIRTVAMVDAQRAKHTWETLREMRQQRMV